MHKALLKSGAVAALALMQSGMAYAAPDDAAAAAPAAEVAAAELSTSAVIVTGTRTSGLKVENSASPVQVLDSSSLQRTGQPDLIQALAQNLPSFTAQAVGGDTANLTLSARLRGLSPNDTLVLVNGKRRHGTANLAILGGPFQGGAAADLNYIPVSAIDHIEVLQDGAAAQYGSDAIAGVINIILKSNYHGGTASVTGGGYSDGGGRTGDGSFNAGFEPFEKAFLSITGESKYHGYSDRGGIDPRVIDPATMAANPTMVQAPGYPNVNHISGDAQYHLDVLAANFGFDINDVTQLYSFATIGTKNARAFENYRLPTKLPTIYPTGFSPQETMKEQDGSFTLGIKGKAAGWNWDLSSTYGSDVAKIGNDHSGNVSLLADTGATPTTFHAGQFQASQLTTTAEANHEYEIGASSPLNVAVGVEHRIDKYEIDAGDAASRYKEGSQAYPGFSLTDAGSHRRTNEAAYFDLSVSPVKGWLVDLAGRYEHFSDFGNAKVGKLTSRYDFTPDFAIRGTFSNGFRAPTLAEEFYSATNVSPRSAFVQLAPNSAGARLVGIDGLKAERSDNVSVGFVLTPAKDLTLTLDAYQIKIRDRIVGSGQVYGSGSAVVSPAVTAAILANGNVLDPSVTQTGINIFSNAVDTRNRGVEFVSTLASNFGKAGRVDWSAAFNYNQVKVTKINQAPTQLQPQTLLDATALSDLETASPKFRLNLGALWKAGAWSVNLRETIYGKSSEQELNEAGDQYYTTTIARKGITDLEVAYTINKSWTLAVGANNLFNQYPSGINPEILKEQRAGLDNGAVTVLPSFSPFGIDGGYYYARANYKF